MKKLIFVLGLLGWASLAAGESRSCFLRRCSWYGLDDRRGKLDLSLNGGVGLNQIEAITATLASGSSRPNYTWNPLCRMNPSVGFYCVYQQGMLGFDVGAEYFMLRSKTEKAFSDHTETYTFDYHTDATVPYARTRHYTAEGDIETYTFCDNLLRPIQVKKTGVVEGAKVNIVSGRQQWDAFGRVTSEGLPFVEPVGMATTLNTTNTSEGVTQTAYDVYDRTVFQMLPDSIITTIKYEIRPGGVGQELHTIVTDPAGHKSESVTDERGRTVKEVKYSQTGDLTVDYAFDALGQLLEVTHPNDRKTTYTYDGLGRTLSVDHPDAGLTTFTYDLAGNLLTKQTAKLRSEIASGGVITYKYDYNRLTDIVYPKNVFNCVKYTYGEPGAPYGRAGCLVLVEDASGGEEFFYGAMGEQVKSIRTVMRSITDMRTFVTESSYDSWGRIRTLSYPDGEVVTYGYDAAGQLTTMQGEKDGFTTQYIADSEYDKFGNLTYRLLGNGTEERYSYDPRRQHLTRSQLSGRQGAIMDNKYSYDNIDNVISIVGSVAPQAELGGRYEHHYQYDDLSRLTLATGSCRDTIGYSLKMTYNNMSAPMHKNLQVFGSSVLQSQDFDYLYEDNSKPNAVTQVGQDKYHYDASGNVTYIERDTTWRELTWDEENRLAKLSDNGYTSRYTYDHTGNRTLKSYGPVTEVGINGAAQGIIYHDDDNYTMYPSPYITVDKDRYTKHYYAGTKRICATIGTGDFHNIFGVDGFTLSAGGKDYGEKMKQIEEARRLEVKKRGVPPGLPTQKGKTAEPEYYGSGYPELVLGDYSVPEGWPGPNGQLANPAPGVPLSFDDPIGNNEAKAGAGFVTDHQQENDHFYFHSDHLGSTSYLTDNDGNVSQFVCYTPYGETLVDEHLTDIDSILHNGAYRTKYLFNGKELDSETGLYYYGARYYEPKHAFWYGVDPLAEKYPFNGGYVYCSANPVKYVDPDGNAPVYDPEGNLIGTDDEGLQGKALIMNPEDFQQGMSHDDAMKLNLGKKGLSSEESKAKFLNSYNSLSNRPDWDGIVTDEEARDWWINGNGQTLFIDASKIDLSPLSTSTLKKENDYKLRYNFFLSPRSAQTTARVHGTLSMRLKSTSTGEVAFFRDQNGYFDTYDFNPDGRKIRDFTTKVARKIVGEGIPYGFKLYGPNPKVRTK